MGPAQAGGRERLIRLAWCRSAGNKLAEASSLTPSVADSPAPVPSTAMSFPIGLQPQERRQEWIPLSYLSRPVMPPPAERAVAAARPRSLPPPPPPRPWTLPPSASFSPPPPPPPPLPPAPSFSPVPQSGTARSSSALPLNEEPSRRRLRASSTEPGPSSSSSSSTPPPKRRRRTPLELWSDSQGRKGEIWCHGCGERVGGIRFACEECLSFELVS